MGHDHRARDGMLGVAIDQAQGRRRVRRQALSDRLLPSCLVDEPWIGGLHGAIPTRGIANRIEAELRSWGPNLAVHAARNVRRRGDRPVHLRVPGRGRPIADQERPDGGAGAVGRDEDVTALRPSVGEPCGDPVFGLVDTDALGVELDRVLADHVEQRPMKRGATKAERRRAELPSDGTGRMVDDAPAPDVAELHPLDRRRDALDAFERPDACEDPRPVRPKAQAVPDLEVADRACPLEDLRVEVGTAKRQPEGQSADPRSDDEYPRHAHTIRMWRRADASARAAARRSTNVWPTGKHMTSPVRWADSPISWWMPLFSVGSEPNRQLHQA